MCNVSCQSKTSSSLPLANWPNWAKNRLLLRGGHFGYFSFSCSVEGKGESEASEGGGGFKLKIPRGGVLPAGRVSAGTWGCGGVNIFFRVRNPQ